ncbi:S1 family peptidase [Enterovibrio paralichthyis]|uniref:S1 family peptidase n=1 Tax=Enterovibrio paralichthyis TaxID=2853805 RepID=UPI001C48FB53|nr:serine protease [Enterovibrio paralichthyis]MBV7296398.1 serine protease [Enterovibrio paralichthyis]
MTYENNITELQQLYAQYAGAVAYVSVENADGTAGIGSAFHIGDGIFVTAKHVIESQTIVEVATTKRVEVTRDSDEVNQNTYHINPRILEIIEGPYEHASEDVAVFRVELVDEFLPKVQLGSHTSHEIQDNEFILTDALVIGYPPIPFTTTPNQVVASGQVNAVIDVRHSEYVHFVLSTMARGGFSGGVALTKSGIALGLVTESLGTSSSLVETGYMSVMSIDAAIELAKEKFDINLVEFEIYRDLDSLIEIKMVNDNLGRLNSRLYNACVYVYDDDRDLFMEIHCDDRSLLHSAYEVFNSFTPTYIIESMSKEDLIFFQAEDNPSASVLVTAAHAVKQFFENAGYKEMSIKKNTWQIKG